MVNLLKNNRRRHLGMMPGGGQTINYHNPKKWTFITQFNQNKISTLI